MRLPKHVRARFQEYGRTGGRVRAARLDAATREAIARRAAVHRWIRVRFGAPTLSAAGLPGGDVVDAGLEALLTATETVESLAVSLAAPRLRREGVPVPHPVIAHADERLYRLLERRCGGLAHARYLAYLRQMFSFANACAIARKPRGTPRA